MSEKEITSNRSKSYPSPRPEHTIFCATLFVVNKVPIMTLLQGTDLDAGGLESLTETLLSRYEDEHSTKLDRAELIVSEPGITQPSDTPAELSHLRIFKPSTDDGLVAIGLGDDSALPSIQIIDSIYASSSEIYNLRAAALTDPLTGLRNRRYIEHALEKSLATAQRYDHPVSLAFLDLDNFKHINDRYGHECGDQLLREWARLIDNAIREADTLARYGGDEFILLMPMTGRKGAESLISRISANLVAHIPLGVNKEAVKLSFSAGIAVFEPGESPGNAKSLLQQADQQMLEQKRK